MSNYLKNAVDPATQREQLPGQVANSAGGFSFAVGDWGRLDRFLILGSEGGSYYAKERTLTRENAAVVERCVKADGQRVVRTVVEVSDQGRAPKNDPAILALALAARLGDDDTRAAAYAALPKVCRTGTHLYHFVAFADSLGGWGRGLRRAVASWFNSREVSDIAYQLVKYQQRDGWSARDLLRLSHAKPRTADHSALYQWVCKGESDGLLPGIVDAFERAKKASSASEVCALIREHNLPREAIPTQYLTEASVWEALLERMPLTAMIRNLATMTRIGVVAPLSAGTERVRAEITDGEKLRRSRVHPIQVLSALKTYAQGHGERGGHTWTPVGPIVDALDAAFYASFGNVRPSGKRWMLALDVSGSMFGGVIAGVPGLFPAMAAAAMAMVTQAVEPRCHVVGFSGARTGLLPLDISAKRRLDDVMRVISGLPFNTTDCSLPFRVAQSQKLEVDAFAVYTDNETYEGPEHAHVSLAKYRRATGIDARSVVVGMISNGFTIASPSDPGMLDVVGFDTSAPQVISEFARGSKE